MIATTIPAQMMICFRVIFLKLNSFFCSMTCLPHFFLLDDIVWGIYHFCRGNTSLRRGKTLISCSGMVYYSSRQIIEGEKCDILKP